MSDQPWRLDERDPRKIYHELRSLLRRKPRDDQPAEKSNGLNVDLHLITFLECLRKFATRRNIRIRVTYRPPEDDGLIAIDAESPREVLRKIPKDHTFVLFLRTVMQYGVYRQQVSAFRELFALDDDDKLFFQVAAR